MTGTRLTTLDAIRGIAAVYVVIGHFHSLFLPVPLQHFWLAVDIFFLMSGFVLGKTYEPRLAMGMTRGAFMLNRYIRLYPLYLIAMVAGIVSALLTLALHKGKLGPVDLIVASVTGLLVLPSPTWTVSKDVMPLNFPGWSLFFELFVSLLLALFHRLLKTPVLIALIAANGLFLLRGSAPQQFGGESWANFWWGFPRIGFSFFLGYLLQRYHPGPQRISDAGAWIVLAAVGIIFWINFDNRLGDGLIAMVFSPAVIWFAAYVQPRHDRIFEWLGTISYPAYVIHIPLASFLWRGLLTLHLSPEDYAPWSGFVVLALVLIAAPLLDRMYDRPLRRFLNKRLFRTSASAQLALKKDTPL